MKNKDFNYFINKLITKPNDPFIAYEWSEVQDIEKYPRDHPILAKLHLILVYKLIRVIVYDFKNKIWS